MSRNPASLSNLGPVTKRRLAEFGITDEAALDAPGKKSTIGQRG